MLTPAAAACSVSLTHSASGGANVTAVPLLAASNASCWFSYSLFVASGKPLFAVLASAEMPPSVEK